MCICYLQSAENAPHSGIERDLRQMKEIHTLSGFRTLVGLCAGRVGQRVINGGERSETRHGIRVTNPRGWSAS